MPTWIESEALPPSVAISTRWVMHCCASLCMLIDWYVPGQGCLLILQHCVIHHHRHTAARSSLSAVSAPILSCLVLSMHTG